MKICSVFAGWAVPVFLGIGMSLVQGADKPPPLPPYPRQAMTVWYEVDSAWPQRPPGVAWGQRPGVAVDPQNRVWVFTRAKPPVQVYDASGKYLFGWGEDVIQSAHQIRLDRQGHVWLVDGGNHAVYECTQEGKVLRTLGTPGQYGEDPQHFHQPTDVVITPKGDIFVTDGYGNSRVVHFDAQGRFVRAWGKLGVGPGEFSLPHAIDVDSQGRLYVADRNNVRIQVFDQEGKFLAEWRNLLVPWTVRIDQKDRIWSCGSSPMVWRKEDEVLGCPPKDQLVMCFDTTGKVLQVWTFPKGQDGQEKPGELNWVHSLAWDSQGNLYLVDIIGKRVQKFLRRE